MNSALRNKTIIYMHILFEIIMVVLSQITLIYILLIDTIPISILIKAYIFALAGIILVIKSLKNGYYLLLLFVFLVIFFQAVWQQEKNLEDFVISVFAVFPWVFLTLATAYFHKLPHFVIGVLIILRLKPISKGLIKLVRDELTVKQARKLMKIISRFGTEHDAEQFCQVTAAGSFPSKTWAKGIKTAREYENDEIAHLWDQCRSRSAN